MKKQKRTKATTTRKKSTTSTKAAAKKAASPALSQLFADNGKKKVLHVGCGDKKDGSGLHAAFQTTEWHEVRLDISESVKPDIVADMTDMKGKVPDNAVDAVWSSHNLEHLYIHQVPDALKEFYRVLKPGGVALVTMPNLQKVAEEVAKGKLEAPLYYSPSGPVSAIDIMYGYRESLKNGHYYMAHKCGFSKHTLTNKFIEAGFGRIHTYADEGYNLWSKAYKVPLQKGQKPQVEVEEDDINAMMKSRDELDKAPQLWTGYPA